MIWLNLSLIFISICSLAMSPGYGYLDSDNFEFIVPLIEESHSRWLDGQFPIITFYQHMGDPLIGNGQAGIFYFPYTLCLLLIRILNLRMEAFAASVVWFHAFVAANGWWLWLRLNRIPKFIAFATAVGIATGGLYHNNSSIWLDMTPSFAWLSWTLWGLQSYWTKPNKISATVITFSCALMGFSGHPQMIVYYGLATIFFSISYLFFWRPALALWSRGLLPIVIGILISAPTLCSVFNQYSYSSRVQAWTREIFAERSTNLEYLLSILSPAFSIKADFLMSAEVSLLLFQGSWVIYGLILGLLSVTILRRSQGTDLELKKSFLTIFFAALPMFWLSTGSNGGLYDLTYGLPIWSSFRWPFRMYYLALPMMSSAAACGCAMKPSRILGFGLLIATAVAFIIFPTPKPESPFILATIGTTFLGIAAFTLPKEKWRSITLLITAIVGAFAITCLSFREFYLKYQEQYATVGAKELGIEENSRALAFTPIYNRSGKIAPPMQNFGHFQSAAMNRYESATGCVTALNPIWRAQWLPSDVYGVPIEGFRQLLPGSNLSDSFNIGHFIVGKNDLEGIQNLETKPFLIKANETPNSFVYRNLHRLPQVYWADNQARFSKERFISVMLLNKGTQRTALIEADVEEAPLQNPQIDPLFKKSGSEIEVDVSNPKDGTLVLSFTWYPSWKAYIDGKPASINRTNGAIMSIQIPANSNHLSVHFEDQGLKLGIWLAVFGALLGLTSLILPWNGISRAK